MKTVSIVVPIYNQAKVLPMTLDRILHQDYPDLEIILCDDASTDGTREVLECTLQSVERDVVSYASGFERTPDGVRLLRTEHKRYPQHRRIQVIHNAENLGAVRNYNVGFRQATGDYCTFIVGDDLPHPTMISELVEALETREADFAYADMFVVDDDGNIIRKFELPDFDFETSLANWYLVGNAKLFRRRWLDDVGYFDESLTSAFDYDLWVRFALAGARFVHVPKVLYSLRTHGPGRKVGLHAPEVERRALEESARIAERARRAMLLARPS